MEKTQQQQLESAHAHSSDHRQSLEESETCGCFYCKSTFRPDEVREWIDGGQTALCPRCGIDSVLGSKSGYPVTDVRFLSAMASYWFD